MNNCCKDCKVSKLIHHCIPDVNGFAICSCTNVEMSCLNSNCPCHTPKVPQGEKDWEKDFWDRYADRTNLTYKVTNPQVMADFIHTIETEATQRGREEVIKELELRPVWYPPLPTQTDRKST